jgi:hypothetical protein
VPPLTKCSEACFLSAWQWQWLEVGQSGGDGSDSMLQPDQWRKKEKKCNWKAWLQKPLWHGLDIYPRFQGHSDVPSKITLKCCFCKPRFTLSNVTFYTGSLVVHSKWSLRQTSLICPPGLGRWQGSAYNTDSCLRHLVTTEINDVIQTLWQLPK